MMYDYYIVQLKRKKWLPLSKLIEFIEHKNYSHVEIMRIEKETDSIQYADFYGSVMPESRKANFRQIDKHYSIHKAIKLNVKIDDEACESILESYLHIKYGFGQLFKILLKTLFHVVFLSKNPSKYSICTEYVGYFMQEACFVKWQKPLDYLTLDNIEDMALEGKMQDDFW